MLNLKHFKSITLGDVDSEKEILKLLKQSELRFLKNIEEAIHTGDERLWQSSMHEMKGGAASVGADRIHELCKKFEKNTDKEIWPEILQNAKKEFLELTHFIQQNLQKTF